MKDLSLVLALLAICLTIPLNATTFYVATDGVDATDVSGQSLAEAWATVSYALSNVNAGDTIAMVAGTYSERISFNVSGTAGAPIVLRNHANDTVVISGVSGSGQDALLQIIDQSHVVVQGLIFQDNVQNNAQGILISGACEGVEIKNNTFINISFTTNSDSIPGSGDNAQPLIVYGSDASTPVSHLLISGNAITDCIVGQSEALAINGNVDSFNIVLNRLQNITNIGIDIIGGEGTSTANDQPRNGVVSQNDVDACRSPYATAAGIYLDGARDIVVERNEVTSCQWGIEVGSENVGTAATGNVVKNNVMYLNRQAGLAIGGIGGTVGDLTVRNNTILGSDADNFGDPTAQVFITASDDVRLFNNIIYKLSGSTSAIIYATGASNLSMDYNIYYTEDEVDSTFEINGSIYDGIGALIQGTSMDSNSMYIDPELRSVIPADFYLEVTSPAIDAGDTATVVAIDELDYRGEIRLINDQIDIGATEYNGPLPVTYLRPFAAELIEEAVLLTWHTAVEINSDHFAIERSDDLETWKVILTTPSVGSSFAYEHLDIRPLRGKSYYRLKQVDLDGSEDISGIQAIFVADDLAVFPNPTSTGIINVRGLQQSGQIILTDMSGRMVRSWNNTKENRTLDLNGLSTGIYILRILDTSSTKSFKLFLE